MQVEVAIHNILQRNIKYCMQVEVAIHNILQREYKVYVNT